MSVESFGFKFVVDAKDAAKGYGDFQRAIDGVFSSMQRFEAQAKKSLDAVTASSKRGQGDIAKYAAQFKALQSIPVDGSAAPKLLKLSDAMARFKAPSQSQVGNLRAFFSSLQRLPDLGATTRSISNIAKLSAAMNGFKAPSSAQAVKLVEFAKALQQVGPGLASLSKVSGVSGIANELASISIALGKLKIPSAGQANNLKEFSRALQMMRLGGAGNAAGMLEALSKMNGFKAPTQAQTRNLQSFVNAVNNLKVPENAGRISAYLMQIAESARVANSSLQGFRGSLNSLGYGMKSVPWGGFTSGAHKARLEMMGLQNAFSGTFQVGSLLRSVLGSLTIGELGRQFFTAVQAANQFHASMEVLGQTPMMQSKEWDRVRADANHFGQDLITFSDGFSKFAVAAHESGMGLAESFKVWEGFSTVMSAMHLGQEQQQSVGLAIREIMDQGYVSTQRLTRQLGLVLPGSLATLQKAWAETGKKGVNFFDALKKKMVDGQWALDTLAEHYKKVYGPALAAALESPIQQFNILKNNVSELMIQIGNDGAKKAFADFIAKLSGGLDPSHMKSFAQSISDGLVKALHRAGDAVDWLRANWDAIRGPLGAALSLFGKWMVLSAAFKIGASIVTPLLNARRAFAGFNVAMAESVAAGGRVRTMFAGLLAGVAPLPVGLGKLNISAMAATTGMNMLRVAGNLLKVGLTGLMNLVGGPLGMAMIGLTTIIGAVTSHMMNASIQVSEMSSASKDALDPLNAMSGFLSKNATDAMNAALGIHGVGEASQGASAHIDDVGNKALTAAEKFHKLATEARNAMIAMNNANIAKLQQQNIMAHNSTMSGAEDNFNNKMPSWMGGGGKGFDSMKDFFGGAYNKVGAIAGHIWDNGASDRALEQAIGKNNQTITALQKSNADILKATDKQINDSQHDPLNDTPTGLSPLYKGATGAKGKKGKDPEKALEAFQNQMSEIMDKLMDGDPVGKLFSKFVQEITKQGQVLLNTKSYHAFFENMNADAKTGKVSVDSLIAAIQNGGLKGKALKDLEDRYGTNVQGLIRMLRKEQQDYEDAVKDATAKALKDIYKGVDDAMKKIAEHNPLMKAQLEFSDAMTVEAQKFLNKDAFTDWMKHTEEDADGAATAMSRLIKLLGDGKNLASGVESGLRARGMNMGQVIGSIQTDGVAEKSKEVEARRSMTFGAETITQLQRQYELEGLVGTKQEVLTKLQEEYNKAVEQGHPPGQALLDQMAKQITYWDQMIERQKAMKEFYENNGIKTYLADVKTAGQFVHEFDNNFLKGLEDTLYTLGTTGKLSFKNLLDSMQSQIIRFASQGITSKIASILSPHSTDPNNKNPTIFGFMGKLFGGKHGNDYQPSNKDLISESYMRPLRVTVDNMGQLHAGGGLGDAGANPDDPLSSILGAGDNPFSSSDLGPDGLLDPSKMFDFSGIGQEFTSTFDSIQPKIADIFTQNFKGIGGQFGGILQSLLGGMGSGGGGGGFGGILGSLFGGGGGGGGGMGDLGSLFDSSSLDFSSLGDIGAFAFKEGGYSNSSGVGAYSRLPASAFFNAPHYAEGTGNTSGIPAVLHDNEAVIPLSRGRKVPVELTSGSTSGNGGGNQIINNNFNISSPDADSFRKSKSQIATELHAAGARSWARDNT